MTKMPVLLALLTVACPAYAEERKEPVVITPILKTMSTISGQQIVLPRRDVQLIVTICEIAPGAVLPVHQHPYQRYGYVLSGTFAARNQVSGVTTEYRPGDFIVESVGQRHSGVNIGRDPVKLLVIDQVEAGTNNVITGN